MSTSQNIKIYTPAQIEKIRIACKLAADVLLYIEPYVQPGVSTEKLDDLVYDYIVNVQKAIPACLNYHGFPKSICTSVNHVVCHGIPNAKEVLRKGDILNIDVTVIKDGYYGDNSKMYIVGGETTPRSQELVNVTQESLYNAIKVCRPGAKFSEIGNAIAKTVRPHSFSIVREYIGHGVGDEFHTAPEVLHYPNSGTEIMAEGMVFTIEPMINNGDWRTRTLRDGWTAITRDKQNSAQFEHQLLITKDGCEVMTIREEEIATGKLQRYMHNIPVTTPEA